MTHDSTTVLAVDFARRPRLKALGGGLYVMEGREGFYARPVCGGKQRERKLRSLTERAARAELGKLLHAIARFEAGIGPDPWRDATSKSLADLVKFFIEQGCPGKRANALRASRRDEERRAETLSKWPGARRAAGEITLEVCADYHRWRTRQIKRGKGGDRQVDKELVTLSNIFRCAMRSTSVTGIVANPVGRDRPRFRDANAVRHCRESMPRSGDVLHQVARALFERSTRSEVLGWVMLIAAITGQRVHEVLSMRMDATDKSQAGYLSGKRLYLFRSTTNKGTYSHVDLTNDESDCLAAHRAWHTQKYASSPWYFPSEQPGRPVGTTALTHALIGLTKMQNFPHITAHGLRAFRVNVLRGRGLSDGEIALRIGQKTQGRLIVTVYGEGLDYTLRFVPEDGLPAWSHFEAIPQPQQLTLL